MMKKNNVLDVNVVFWNVFLYDMEVGFFNVGFLDEEVEKEKEKMVQILLYQFLLQRLNLNKVMDELVGFMVLREKGDIRDVFFMSLFFVVLVYILQCFVCLYCVVWYMLVYNFQRFFCFFVLVLSQVFFQLFDVDIVLIVLNLYNFVFIMDV